MFSSGATPTPATAGSASDPPQPRLSWRAALVAAGFILLVAAVNLHFFYSRGLINLYGDAVAHMEGARRLTDSLTPGYDEIGTGWLPLYHVLVAPLAVNDFLWRTGLGGGLVSTAAFAFAAWFLFLLGFEMSRSLAAGWIALIGFLACANMLYVASTPLTESLNILWAVLVVWGLFRFQQDGRLVTLAGASVAALLGALTRYDGWYLLPFAALFVLQCRRRLWRDRLLDAAFFSCIAGIGPFLWLLHNLHRYGNPIDFYNGPYSAQAIYAHQLATTGFAYPTAGSRVLSLRYYLETLKLVIGAGSLELAMLGVVAWAVDSSERIRRSAALLLLVPFVFYVQSMANATIPIYVPTLFPHTYYNLRYGLEMLPAAALLPSFVLSRRLSSGTRLAVAGVLLIILGVQFWMSVRAGTNEIGMVKETLLNTPCNSKVAQALEARLRGDDSGIILMAAGHYPCVLPSLGIPYRRTLTEDNRRFWRQIPEEPEHWPADSPLRSVTWIVRGDGDVVDQAMRAYPGSFAGFELLDTYRFPREDTVRVYRRERGDEDHQER
jgi:hypothetical protein